jgi:hypothetical protein
MDPSSISLRALRSLPEKVARSMLEPSSRRASRASAREIGLLLAFLEV